jgi:hypothetical protein
MHALSNEITFIDVRQHGKVLEMDIHRRTHNSNSGKPFQVAT